jgi:hypothetical protein
MSGYPAPPAGAEVVTQTHSEEQAFFSQELPLAGGVCLSPLPQVNPPSVYNHHVNGEESYQLLITCIY